MYVALYDNVVRNAIFRMSMNEMQMEERHPDEYVYESLAAAMGRRLGVTPPEGARRIRFAARAYDGRREISKVYEHKSLYMIFFDKFWESNFDRCSPRRSEFLHCEEFDRCRASLVDARLHLFGVTSRRPAFANQLAVVHANAIPMKRRRTSEDDVAVLVDVARDIGGDSGWCCRIAGIPPQ